MQSIAQQITQETIPTTHVYFASWAHPKTHTVYTGAWMALGGVGYFIESQSMEVIQRDFGQVRTTTPVLGQFGQDMRRWLLEGITRCLLRELNGLMTWPKTA